MQYTCSARVSVYGTHKFGRVSPKAIREGFRRACLPVFQGTPLRCAKTSTSTMLRDLVFVHVLKGKHKDREGYIVGETQAFYWVKICGLVRPGSEDRACFAKHNVLQVAHVKNKTWERWVQEDPTLMLAELLEEQPQKLVEANTRWEAARRDEAERRDSIINELLAEIEHLALVVCSVQIRLAALCNN